MNTHSRNRIVGIGHLFALFAFVLLVAGCARRARNGSQLAAQLATNHVGITVRQTAAVITAGQVVFVGGEVRKPDRLIWTNGLTLTSAIQSAGGFTDFANLSRLELRRSDGFFEVFRYAAILNRTTNDPVLHPNDQVRVHKKASPLPPEVWAVLRTLL